VFFRGLRSVYFFLPPAHRGDDLLHHLLIAHEIPLMKVIDSPAFLVRTMRSNAGQTNIGSVVSFYRPLLFLFTVPNFSIA